MQVGVDPVRWPRMRAPLRASVVALVASVLTVGSPGASANESTATDASAVLPTALSSGEADAGPMPRRILRPQFSWQSSSFDKDFLGGLPIDVVLTYDRAEQPWLIAQVNRGLDAGTRLFATTPSGTGWKEPQELGITVAESQLTASTSPDGPVVAWRSGDQTISLGRLTGSTWETTTVNLTPQWFEEHWYNAKPVRVPGMTYILTVSQRTRPFGTGYAIAWPDGSRQATVTEFQAPPDLAGTDVTESSHVWGAWMTSSGTIRLAYFQTTTSSSTSLVRGNIVVSNYDSGSAQWGPSEVVRSGVIGAFGIIQHVTRGNQDILVFTSRDREYGQIAQVEIVRGSGTGWSEPVTIANQEWSSPLPAVTAGPICVSTGNGTWTYDESGMLNRLAKPRAGQRAGASQGERRRWGDPINVYRTDLQACLVLSSRSTVTATDYSVLLPGVKGATVSSAGASTATSTGVAHVSGTRVVYSQLVSQQVAPPGPVSNLRIDGRKRSSVTISWDPPVQTPYPSAQYQVRVSIAGAEGKWGRGITHRKIQVPTPKTGVAYVVQVRTANAAGESQPQTLRFVS